MLTQCFCLQASAKNDMGVEFVVVLQIMVSIIKWVGWGQDLVVVLAGSVLTLELMGELPFLQESLSHNQANEAPSNAHLQWQAHASKLASKQAYKHANIQTHKHTIIHAFKHTSICAHMRTEHSHT